MKTSLLVLNEGGGGGRKEKFKTRERLLAEEDWAQLTYTFPTKPSPRLLISFIGALRTVIREDIDVIHSVSNPFHLHVIALVLSFVSRRPWVAEFRDPLVTNPDVDPKSWHSSARKIIESVVVRTADRVAWLNMIQLPKNYFQETYPSVPTTRWVELPPIGYEADLFEGVEPAEFDEFTVVYAGSFYEGWIEPYNFLDGVEGYVSQHGDDINVRFYGDWSESYEQYVSELGIEKAVSHEGRVSHDEVVPVLMGADLQLYIGGSNPRNCRSISSKMWDYIGARSPVLAIAGSEFRVHDFVEQNRLGLTATPEDVDGIAEAIRAVKTGSYEYEPDENVFSNYTRQQNAKVLADAMDELAE